MAEHPLHAPTKQLAKTTDDDLGRTISSCEGIVEDAGLDVFGYDQKYRRTFGSIANLCITLAIASPANGILVIATYQIVYGGYWGLVWGWLIPAVLFFPQALAIAALCSAMPVNGAFYWWAAALAPPKWSRLAAYMTGWTMVLTAVTSLGSFSFAIASPLLNVVGTLHPSWTGTPAQEMATAMAVVLLWTGLSCLHLETMKSVVICTTVLTLTLTLAFLIGMPAVRAAKGLPFANAADVFGQYSNSSDWDRGAAVCLTFLSSAWVVSGWSTPALVVEGTKDPSRSAPKAIVSSYCMMAGIGFPVCIMCAFCIPDIASAAADESGLPLYTMVFDTFGVKGGSAYFLLMNTNLMIGASSFLLSNACNLAAFARDGGVPYADLFARVHPALSVPIPATLALSGSALLLLLLALSPEASGIIYSLAVTMSIINYATPIALALAYPSRFIPGPFNYGRFTRPIFAWALASQIFLVTIESFPSSRNWTAATFNYQFVITLGSLLIVATMWPFVRKRFRGVNVEMNEQRIRDASSLSATDGIANF